MTQPAKSTAATDAEAKPAPPAAPAVGGMPAPGVKIGRRLTALALRSGVFFAVKRFSLERERNDLDR